MFVVHGRNGQARDAMFIFLRALGLQPIEWSQARAATGKASPYIGEILDAAFDGAQAVLVLMTPDEITYLRSEYSSGPEDGETQPAPQARPNVLFEAGMAMGRDADRTVLVELGSLRPFSDVAGRHAVRLREGPEGRQDIAQRLLSAGCAVDMSGTDWLTAGDFTPPPEPGLPLGKRVPATNQPHTVKIDVRYHDRGTGKSGRLEVLNLGRESLYDINVEVPPIPDDERGDFQIMSGGLPIPRLPPGKSHALYAHATWLEYCDVVVTARTDSGESIREEIFVSLNG
ncbi:MAG: nucleotide-binding protein [Actinobacteria bacterium]|nr:nucleotide-binding protein [Actinomycetota bacterium]